LVLLVLFHRFASGEVKKSEKIRKLLSAQRGMDGGWAFYANWDACSALRGGAVDTK